uniref:ADF-H domain-containing protein n=1 Tax=Acrobeloides nanus TaxID=290746 RepID=A0A914DWP3_9BILA
MSSGIVVNPECFEKFQLLAEKKESLRYIIYKIQGHEIAVESVVTDNQLSGAEKDYENDSKATYEALVNDLKERTNNFSDCRYAVFDFKFTTVRPGAGTSKLDKIIFILLCPDCAPVKQKMVYASSAAAIQASLGAGKFTMFQVSDEAELAHKELLDKLSDKYNK